MSRLIASLLALGSLAFAKPPAADIWSAVRPAIRTFGTQEGPPNMSVYAICQDRSERLWVGTQDGTALYNGSTWTTLRLPASSPSQFVRSLAETPDGSRWIGTEGGGLWRLKDGRWTQFKVSTGFPANSVNFLTVVQSPQGGWVLWAALASGGAARFDGTAWQFMDRRAGLPSEFLWKIRQVQDPDGSTALYAATTRGFARYVGDRWQPMTAKEGWPEHEVNDIASVIHPDGSSHLWLAIQGKGMARWDGRQWEHFDPTQGSFPSYFPISLQVSQDPSGLPVLWVSTYDRGLVWYSQGGWQNLGTHRGLPSNGIYGLYAPRKGRPTLWMGLRGGGLVSLNLSGWRNLDAQMGIPGNEIHAFAETRLPGGEPTLWIGTSEGLAHWDGRAWLRETTRDGLPHDHISCLLVRRGPAGEELLAGTLRGLVRRVDGRWRPIPGLQDLEDPRVLSLLETRAESGRSTLWIGTAKGLIRLDDGRQTLVSPPNGLPDLQAYALCATRDPDGRESLWVGTRRDGIARLTQGRWLHYGEAEGLTNLSVYSFREIQDRKGTRWLWACTFGGGACRFNLDDPSAKGWESFRMENLPGLPSNVVARVEADAEGRIYLITQRGVARLSFDDPVRVDHPSTVENFKAGDGLPPVSTNYGASLMDHAGRLWVATNAGAAVLDPSLEQPPPPLPAIIVENVVAGGLPRELNPQGTVLGFRENRLSFEVGLPLFYREEDLRYRTQLIGVEDQPSPWSSNPRREFLSLPVGTYLLRVEAEDHLGRRALARDYPLRVRPAPWRSPWAYGAYALLTALTLLAAHWLRVRLLRARNAQLGQRIAAATAELEQNNQKLQELNEEKNHFMGIAAHDLKNPLSAVLMAAQHLSGPEVDPEDRRHFAGLIERATRQMSHLIQDMLDINRLDTGRLELHLQAVDLTPVAESVRAAFEPMAQAKGIRLHLAMPASLVAWADPVHIQGVLENFVSNAIKFTRPAPPERAVEILAWAQEGMALLEVRDQGPGFTDEDLRKVFGRFTRLSARPTAGESSSGLGLSIAKRLVEAMDGTIALESEWGKGSTFRVALHLLRVEPEPEAGPAPSGAEPSPSDRKPL